MQFEPRFNVGNKVYWVTNLVISCESCGNSTHETKHAVWSGEVVSVMFERRKLGNPPLHLHVFDASIHAAAVASDCPPEYEDFIQYQVRPDGEHKSGNILFSEENIVGLEEEAQQALENLTKEKLDRETNE